MDAPKEYDSLVDAGLYFRRISLCGEPRLHVMFIFPYSVTAEMKIRTLIGHSCSLRYIYRSHTRTLVRPIASCQTNSRSLTWPCSIDLPLTGWCFQLGADRHVDRGPGADWPTGGGPRHRHSHLTFLLATPVLPYTTHHNVLRFSINITVDVTPSPTQPIVNLAIRSRDGARQGACHGTLLDPWRPGETPACGQPAQLLHLPTGYHHRCI